MTLIGSQCLSLLIQVNRQAELCDLGGPVPGLVTRRTRVAHRERGRTTTTTSTTIGIRNIDKNSLARGVPAHRVISIPGRYTCTQPEEFPPGDHWGCTVTVPVPGYPGTPGTGALRVRCAH
eukprot:253235-Rhodomonas_salina.2